MDEIEGALWGMLAQFAFEGEKDGVSNYHSGGMSDMEDAFFALALPDPCPRKQFWKEYQSRSGTSDKEQSEKGEVE
jgi:hypothetical protein